jgi:hypothetical protein
MAMCYKDEYRPRFGDVIADPGYSYYCGPAVLSILTGINVRKINQAIALDRNERGTGDRPRKAAVTGMYTHELLGWLKYLGYVPVSIPVANVKVKRRSYGITFKSWNAPTVNQWLRETEKTRGDDVYLFVASHHFFLISGNQMVDCQLGGKVRGVHTMRYKKARISSIHCILRDPDYKESK